MKYCLAVSFVLAWNTALACANLLEDGAFSLATSVTTTSNSAWTLDVNFPDGVHPAAMFRASFGNAENVDVGGPEQRNEGAGIWFRSFEGMQDPGDPLAQAEIAQSVIAPNDGEYILTFLAAREINFTASEFFVEISSSGTGGSSTVDLLSAALADHNLGGLVRGNPTQFDLSLSGVTAGDTLTVRGVMVDGQDALVNPQSAFLDTFDLQFVPEPASVTLVGCGLLSMLLRRQR